VSELQKKFNQVFICYRREASNWVAGRIYDRLAAHFSKETVFQDIDSIPLGSNFREYIKTVVRQCTVFLAVIDDDWMGVDADSGHRRIDDPDDFVRIEIESALERGIRVIPLFVQGAVIPAAESLPPTLKELPNLHGMNISRDPYFHVDMDHLIYELDPILRFKKTDIQVLRWLAIAEVIFIIFLILLGVGMWLFGKLKFT